MTASDVRALHAKHTYAKTGRSICAECGVAWPCKTIEALGPDLLMPRVFPPSQIDAEGREYWPGDPRFTVLVRNVYGECVEQVVEASSLQDALTKALDIPFAKWMPHA